MIKITLPQVTKCDNHNRALTHIDCQHWTANKTTCSGYCTIKNETTNIRKCSYCDLRKSTDPNYVSKEASISEQMKSIMEQTNFYTASNNGIKINETNIPKQSFAEKALSYSKVEGSQLIRGKVSQEVFDKRKNMCMTCPQRINPTPQTEAIGWCKSCGCSSRNPRAALTNKLWMPDWECPQKKFAREEGLGFNVSDAANSLKGVVTSVASLFKAEGNT